MYCGEGKVPSSGTFGGRSSIFEVGNVIADLTSSLGFLVLATGQYKESLFSPRISWFISSIASGARSGPSFGLHLRTGN